MVRVRWETSREHVAELARLRDPVGAVEELVWNALDADCARVVVTLERNDLGGVDRVRIQDDGYGMSAEDCEEYFRPIGSSWKKRAKGTQVRNRALHGKNGRDRVRAFALGAYVQWTSVIETPLGTRQLVIEADRRSMDEFDIGEAEPTTEPQGTLCEAFGGEDLDVLADESARSSLTAAFATYLEKYPDVTLRIEVTDTRGDRLPCPQQAATDAEPGRGLLLVEALADRWGVVPGLPPGKTAWAEVGTEPTGLRPLASSP
ncbi:hypothetical protein RKD38_003397 [Streptomyces ambofaciens]